MEYGMCQPNGGFRCSDCSLNRQSNLHGNEVLGLLKSKVQYAKHQGNDRI